MFKNKILITYPKQHYYCCGGSSLLKQRTANCIRISHSVLALPFSIQCLLFVSGMLLYSNILVVYIPEKLFPHCYVLLLYATYCLCTTKVGAAKFRRLCCIYPPPTNRFHWYIHLGLRIVAEETGIMLL